MPRADCGFVDGPGGPGAVLLMQHGPTLIVNIGFDPKYDPTNPSIPAPNIVGVYALVDTGASQSCIDVDLASKIGLPVVDKGHIAGSGGKHEVDIYLAQIHVTSLNQTIYGRFAGVNLTAGGQSHRALIGRTFL